MPGEAYDEDSIIEGQFVAYGLKTLRANFTNSGMELNWDPL